MVTRLLFGFPILIIARAMFSNRQFRGITVTTVTFHGFGGFCESSGSAFLMRGPSDGTRCVIFWTRNGPAVKPFIGRYCRGQFRRCGLCNRRFFGFYKVGGSTR